MSIDAYNEELRRFHNELWDGDRQQYEILFGTKEESRPPLFAPEPGRTGGILFVGINPSTGRLGRARDALRKLGKNRENDLEDLHVKVLADEQRRATEGKDALRFFQRRGECAEKCGMQHSIEHLDIYPFRVKGKQANALKLLEAIPGLKSKCAKWFDLGLEAHAPKIVWIANLGAYDRYFAQTDYSFGKLEYVKGISDSPRIFHGKIKLPNKDSARLIVTPQLSGRAYTLFPEASWGAAWDMLRST